jgi:glycosyltransferase involved in cell wall biosynthesis
MVATALVQATNGGTRRVRFLALSPDQTFDGSENTAQYLLNCSRLVEHRLRYVPGVSVEVRLGSLDEQAKVALFRASDAVLFPFVATEAVEPPLTLLEAMACGANVVATPAANRSGLVRSSCNGFVGETPAHFAACLTEVLALPHGTTRLGTNARQAVVDRHSFATIGDATAELWARVENVSTRTRGRRVDGT